MKRTYLNMSFLAVIALAVLASCSTGKVSGPNIMTILENDGRFELLARAINAADLSEVLDGKKMYTVFAPSDDALSALGEETLNDLMLSKRESLRQLLMTHVVAGAISSRDLNKVTSKTSFNLSTAETLSGEKVTIRADRGSLFVNDSKIILPDVKASNGFIHVIDTVIMP